MKKHSSPELVVRKMPFEFPEDIDPHWNPTKVEWSHMVNGASLAMPFLEPYLIRTMRKALAKIEDPTLQQEVKHYMGQEGQHYQQHRRFNDILIAAGYEGLRDIEDQMRLEFAEFEKKRSLKFNLAYACGFESMALGLGHWLVKEREYLFGGSDSRVASLILWHFIEEVEHKNVAFDAYHAVYGNYFYRVFGTFYATLHVMKFSRRAYQLMLKKDGLWGKLSSRWKLLKVIMRFLTAMVPPMVVACIPGHHPSKVEDPQWYRDWLATYGQDEHSVVVLDTDNLKASFA
ncbi:putative metal-dependent hydrolase [gamma proteobacterium HIMB55]|nr:putative metal-dependent hydrolase [gamma proteobacterium HIMB55]